MALDDILLGENDNEEYILEIPAGILNAPIDILFEASASADLILEIPATTTETFSSFTF